MDRMVSEYYHTTVVPFSKPREEGQTFFENFPLRRSGISQCITAIPESICDFAYNWASQLWGSKMHLWVQPVTTDPSRAFPLSLALKFLPPSMELNYRWRLSPSHAIWQPLLHYVKCYQTPPKYQESSSETSIYMCNHMVHHSFCGFPWFVSRLL